MCRTRRAKGLPGKLPRAIHTASGAPCSLSWTHSLELPKTLPETCCIHSNRIGIDLDRDNAFWPETQGEFGQFYAPFDWINESADIVLIGITPGKRQAKSSF